MAAAVQGQSRAGAGARVGGRQELDDGACRRVESARQRAQAVEAADAQGAGAGQRRHGADVCHVVHADGGVTVGDVDRALVEQIIITVGAGNAGGADEVEHPAGLVEQPAVITGGSIVINVNALVSEVEEAGVGHGSIQIQGDAGGGIKQAAALDPEPIVGVVLASPSEIGRKTRQQKLTPVLHRQLRIQVLTAHAQNT